jgi:hypothetical protein
VRFIFKRFVELGTYEAVFRECRLLNITGKRWKTRHGRWAGGKPITKASIYHIVGNPVYIGMIRTGDELFQGLHRPIIDAAMWERTQLLREQRAAESRAGVANFNLLTSILFDCFGRSMSINHRRLRSGVRYSYYRSNQNAWGSRQGQKPLRARADELEELVKATMKSLLMDKESIRGGLLRLGYHDERLDRLAAKSELAAQRLGRLGRRELRSVFRSLIARIELSREMMRMVVRWAEVDRFLQWNGIGCFKPDEASWSRCDKTELIEVPAAAARCRRRLYLPIEPRKTPDANAAPGLLRLIREARHAQELVDGNRDVPLHELADRMRLKDDRFARILRLNYLAPDIVTAILDGNHPAGLTRARLIHANLPLDWALQRQVLGFPARASCDGY